MKIRIISLTLILGVVFSDYIGNSFLITDKHTLQPEINLSMKMELYYLETTQTISVTLNEEQKEFFCNLFNRYPDRVKEPPWEDFQKLSYKLEKQNLLILIMRSIMK